MHFQSTNSDWEDVLTDDDIVTPRRHVWNRDRNAADVVGEVLGERVVCDKVNLRPGRERATLTEIKVQTTRRPEVTQDDLSLRIGDLRVGRNIVGFPVTVLSAYHDAGTTRLNPPRDDLFRADRPYCAGIGASDGRIKHVTRDKWNSLG